MSIRKVKPFENEKEGNNWSKKKLFGKKNRDYGWGAFCSERVVNPEFLWPERGAGGSLVGRGGPGFDPRRGRPLYIGWVV